MHLFEITATQPLELQDDRSYSSFAWNGASYCFLEKQGSAIALHCPQMRFQKRIETTKAYTGICYDSKEQCYWCCCGQSGQIIYKLGTSFQETDRFELKGYEGCFGLLKGVAYHQEKDCLMLTYSTRIILVDKHTFCQVEVRCGEGNHSYQVCFYSGGFDYIVSRCCNTEYLTITRKGKTIIYSCLPPEYRILAGLEACGEQQKTLCFLARKHGTYSYLLKGVLCNTSKRQITWGGCRDNMEKCNEARCQEWQEHNHKQEHPDCRWVAGLEPAGSCAAVIESIALEQTALSHILNAEGEKIQKVVAVSNLPDDYLKVNQSVLEMVTKITHLEQVLCSKLELAYNTLKQTGGV